MLTAVPAAAVDAIWDCIQNVSPAAVSTHWWTSVWPLPGVRGSARSQSLPTPHTHELAAVVVSVTFGAPEVALPVTEAPTPEAPENATTCRLWWKPVCAGAERMTAPVSFPVACAFQISETPGRVPARLTSDHVSPPPETVLVCPARPSDDTNASSRSSAFAVVIAGAFCAPLPSTLTLLSTTSVPSPGGGGGGGVTDALSTVTATTEDVFVRPCASVVRAASQCEPSTTVVESQLNEYGLADSVPLPTTAPSTRNCTPPVDAVPAESLTVPRIVVPSAGAVWVIAGGVVSGCVTWPAETVPPLIVTLTSVSLLASLPSIRSLFGSVIARNQ